MNIITVFDSFNGFIYTITILCDHLLHIHNCTLYSPKFTLLIIACVCVRVCVCVRCKSCKCCPFQKTSNKSHIPDDPCKDVKYQEPAIDSMRAQKDEVSRNHMCVRYV